MSRFSREEINGPMLGDSPTVQSSDNQFSSSTEMTGSSDEQEPLTRLRDGGMSPVQVPKNVKTRDLEFQKTFQEEHEEKKNNKFSQKSVEMNDNLRTSLPKDLGSFSSMMEDDFLMLRDPSVREKNAYYKEKRSGKNKSQGNENVNQLRNSYSTSSLFSHKTPRKGLVDDQSICFLPGYSFGGHY